ncbi:hypothetical protein [Christiangramia crocea]|uniref:Uncharacterized protein n=1 Tax=Christiangramia crocea TaxID=2904124 RepID=A0A9X1UV54_9FLAO|nr:hypothetical protein [Gramella crocea]MCG9970972.1 hypothetical protein [Gramella crocea]
MELKGRCREDFKQFLFKELWVKQDFDKHEVTFKDMPFSMQWGIYLDFFDSLDKDMYIALYPNYHCNKGLIGFTWGISCGYFPEEENYFGEDVSREEAQKACLEKANEIYNEKHFVFPHDLDKI